MNVYQATNEDLDITQENYILGKEFVVYPQIGTTTTGTEPTPPKTVVYSSCS